MKAILALALAASLAPAIAANIPRPAPELLIKMSGGRQMSLSSYRGKVVALEFLLTTCPHCQAASEALNRVYGELKARGFQPVGVAINPGAVFLIDGFAGQFGITFPLGVQDDKVAVDFVQHPPMLRMMMPQLVFIDRKGIIRAQYSGEDRFFEDAEKNIREQALALLTEGTDGRRHASLHRRTTSAAK